MNNQYPTTLSTPGLSVPSIKKDAPLKIEEATEEYRESVTERKGKMIFLLGCVLALLILVSVWGLFIFFIQTST
ncbi:hypothetical protein A2962_03610 [Candidatus Woesebacteria bacterium RIFCSPLOWO2_01_FULL_39_61]|uniref:Uncharacterized protein n=1 Tax=Candidatus Woesebacteria bacterium RIFCSPHIGHO2_02_FULL_39_13 TaxID=1802505 RepID=A0A1F7YYV4_9BACT|nr:MAG: hypothetical protein A2692_04045 [Candidatus Woesebacteria bacterium RIFCSPHIGHO2_01_FULL_39_95]OGM32543.1 MAG: hypothetical protein A3D01_01795 [Candidatus Woesebacteria bacterium RIFCSPHIGHO2_02_FULL_39_13]OGM37515.1 MAG: hypothetical protein A3E13_02690 [Candidatus Woesebacteria bacterium RIFCSPHIGHO2_12_FULL_40_20]OGM68191.1 MAG: hypothetical protein A2962_03610 [Candidatus Woesebacteria bacterium RIFCSPLOWO2_01_FULL_39_61]